MNDLFPKPHTFPSVAVAASFRLDDAKYPFTARAGDADSEFDFSDAAVSEFVSGVLDGRVAPKRKSAAVRAPPPTLTVLRWGGPLPSPCFGRV